MPALPLKGQCGFPDRRGANLAVTEKALYEFGQIPHKLQNAESSGKPVLKCRIPVLSFVSPMGNVISQYTPLIKEVDPWITDPPGIYLYGAKE